MKETPHEQHDRFLWLFMEHEESLRVYVRSLLLTREESREVMQEVAVVLWRKFDAEMTSQDFGRWAYGVARMEVLAFRRDRARDRHMFGEAVQEMLAQTILDNSGSLEAERNALDHCLQKLPEKSRRLVQAAYAPGVKINQLSQEMGCTAMTLYKSLHRIRVMLMSCTARVLSVEESH